MVKESSSALKICDWVVKYTIFALIFLMPLFYLPWTSDVLDFNKQALLVLFCFVALFAWMLRTLISGKFVFKPSKIHFAASALFLVYLLATIFSINRYGSFWGWPQISSESLLSSIGLGILYFLVSNTFSKKQIFTGIIVLSVSALIAEIAGVLQLFGVFLFNTIGSAGYLGFFAATLLPLVIVMLIISKKWLKILFSLLLVCSTLVLILVNYPILWWVVLLGSVVLAIFGVMGRNIFDGRWMSLPVFFLMVSVFFILLNPQVSFVSQKANDVFLSQKSSFGISMQAIGERPIFGSGPGTFAYDFSKFKDPSFSQTPIWSVVFSQAGSKVLNDLATTGILGFIALLCFLIFPIFYGVKFIFSKIKSKDESLKANWILVLGFLISLLVQIVAYFLFSSSLVLNFINFLLIAGLVALLFEEKKEYELKPSSLPTLIVTFVFTLVFIFGLGTLILDGQRYVAEVNYFSGIKLWQSGNKNAGTKNLEAAAGLNSSSDLYFVQLSQAYLLTLQDELKSTTASPSDLEKSKVQTLVANAVNAAKIATNLNPNSSSDWANLAYIYQSLYGIIGNSSSWALDSYGRALKLDPNNPYLLSQEGDINFISANQLGQDKVNQKNQFLSSAKSELEKAASLNPNYSNGLFYLGLVYDALGDKNGAIKEFLQIQQQNPKDKTIQAILSNLNAGLPALQQAATAGTISTPTPPANSSANGPAINNPASVPAKK